MAIKKAQEKIVFVSLNKEALRAYQMREMALRTIPAALIMRVAKGDRKHCREVFKLHEAGKSMEEIRKLME
ncbi:MAG: hypothetical protein LBF08_07260 [Dysgonamonadaceae bacterium]|jgi:hypothetical protein|nr:hypothetical protein [Dysgonamonadaceae bacterium]